MTQHVLGYANRGARLPTGDIASKGCRSVSDNAAYTSYYVAVAREQWQQPKGKRQK